MRSRRDVLRDAKIGVVEESADLKVCRHEVQSRRSFITVSLAATGGLLVAMRTEAIGAQMQMPAQTGPLGFPVDYIQIDPDDRVLIWSAQPEMGEGTKTSLPMLIAEELDADWTRVRIDDAPLDRKYGGQGVGGSDAIRSDWDNLRRIGATARALLIASAAAEWNVPASECDTAAHVVRHASSRREARYGALAARAATLTVPRDIALKDPAKYRLIGTRVSGADNHKVVTGQPLFGIDVRLPNMKFAAIAKCPVFNGRPLKIDATKARQVAGVRDVVEIKGLDNPTFLMPGVAVVADSTWAAFKGRDALVIQWEEGPYAGESNATHQRSVPEAARRAAGNASQLRPCRRCARRSRPRSSTTPIRFRSYRTPRSSRTTAPRTTGRPPARCGCADRSRCR